jgi:galactokinase
MALRDEETTAGSPRNPLERRLREHRAEFEDIFGRSPRRARCFFSPGRVNLMGAHLDYNGGPVMPMAVDRGTFFAVRERDDRRVRFASTLEPGEVEFDLDRLNSERAGRWFDYPFGVLRILAGRAASPRGVDLLFGGNLPVGAGLSSSASICVGTAFVLDAVWQLVLEPRERVEAALRAEREFVGVRCGIMDPYAVGFARNGKLLWLDCKDASIEHLPLDHERVGVAVADSGVRRELAQGAFNQRVAEAADAFRELSRHAPEARVLRDVPLEVFQRVERELPVVIARRARHVLEEVARTFAARAALLRDDLATFGAQMLASHRSLRDLYEVSVPELDRLVDSAADAPGVLGARLTGAGFGGCVVILMRRDSADAAMAAIAEGFARRFGRIPSVRFFGGDPGPREVAVE